MRRKSSSSKPAKHLNTASDWDRALVELHFVQSYADLRITRRISQDERNRKAFRERLKTLRERLKWVRNASNPEIRAYLSSQRKTLTPFRKRFLMEMVDAAAFLDQIWQTKETIEGEFSLLWHVRQHQGTSHQPPYYRETQFLNACLVHPPKFFKSLPSESSEPSELLEGISLPSEEFVDSIDYLSSAKLTPREKGFLEKLRGEQQKKTM